MALYWTIDSRQQFVLVTADGDVTHADAEEYLAAIEGCGAVAYRKLYDGRAGNFVMSRDEMMAIGAKIRSQHHRPVGALAIVLPQDQHEPVARIWASWPPPTGRSNFSPAWPRRSAGSTPWCRCHESIGGPYSVSNDNWGWRARIGLFIVGNEAVPEAEWWAMAPSGVSVHAARVTARAPWLRWREDRRDVEPEDDLVRGCHQFAAMRLSAVVIAHSSSSLLGGKGWDEAAVVSLLPLLGDGTIVTTNGIDTCAALRASGAARPFLVLPPWFNDEAVAAGRRYYADHGFELAGHLRYDPGRKWRDLPPGELVGQGLGFEQEIEPLYAQIRTACPADADGVLIAGTGFRCVGILEALEQDLKRPVISANQASLWHCLRSAGVQAKVEGYGSLLRKG
jgi:maleate isomerase